MNVRHVLETKQRRDVVGIQPDQSMREAVSLLVQNNIGALVVCSGDQLHGIVTERDVLRQVAAHPGAFLDTAVREVMTKDLVTAAPDDDVDFASRIMTERRFRHLPILDRGRLVGIMSMGDIVRAQCTVAETEVHYLRGYIAGQYR
jgi:CBS domain-containing protein